MAQPLQLGQLIEKTQSESVASNTPNTLTTSFQTPGVMRCIERYRDSKNFLVTFNPSNQYRYCSDLRRVFMGEAPNLGVVAKAFGDNISIAWLSAQLIDLSEFSGCKDKLDTFQVRSIAEVIMSTWAYFKVSEMMLFFLQFKAGKYGKFYGAVDGLVITEALQEFARERYDQITRYQQEEEARRKAEEDARHEVEVRKYRAALAISNMSISECLDISNKHNLSLEEVAEVGWLFRLGYEPEQIAKESRETAGMVDKVKRIIKQYF